MLLLLHGPVGKIVWSDGFAGTFRRLPKNRKEKALAEESEMSFAPPSPPPHPPDRTVSELAPREVVTTGALKQVWVVGAIVSIRDRSKDLKPNDSAPFTEVS